MDGRETGIDATECCDEFFIRTIIDVHQTEVIVFPIQASSPRMIVVLEPVAPDNLWLPREPLHRRRRADGAMHQTIVLLRHDANPVPNEAHPVPTWPELRDRSAVVEEIVKGPHSLWRHKILAKLFPVPAIIVAQQGHQFLFGVI